MGATVGWVGGHFTKKKSGGGGKGSGGKSAKVNIHYERGWHQICIGPAYALHRIIQNGRTIWTGPIYRTTTPSGSTIDAGGQGEFKIYWGEPDQPVNTYLGGSKRVDISSRWPYICYVEWQPKKLGSAWNWSILDYEIEVRPEFSSLTDTPAWTEPTIGLNTDKEQEVSFIEGTGGVYGDDIISVKGKHLAAFFSGQTIALAGNAVNSDGDRVVASVAYNTAIKSTIIEITTALTTDVQTWFPTYSKPEGTVTPYQTDEDDGANPAHVLDQLMFEDYPHGLGFRNQVDAPFNTDSLEGLGTLMGKANEQFYCSFEAGRGEEALGSLATLLQDMGVLFRFNIKSGFFEFTAIRKPTLSAIPHAQDGMLLPPRPEIATLIGDRPRDKLVFKFSDREINFRDNVVNRDDDSAAFYRGHVKTVEISLTTIINYSSAVTIAERRAQEEHGNMGAVSLNVNREGRALLPGDVLTIDDVASVLRVLEKQIDPDNSKCRLDVMVDVYGVSQTGIQDGPSGGPTPITDEVGGDQFTFIEIPAYLNREEEIEIVVPRIRATDQIEQATIHLSRDNLTYVNAGIETTAVAGGQLAEAVSADDDAVWAQGPQILAVGPDIDLVEDLTGDDTNWRLGRQLCVIEEEIFFLQKITAMGSDLYRLDGLIRARYDTLRVAHPAGAHVYIFAIADVNVFSDILLIAEKPLYVKSQPEATETLSLDEIDPVTKTLVGKGIGPVIPANLRTTNMRNDFATGQDIDFWWAYRSTAVPKTGAGLQGAGEPTSPSPVQGEFVLRFYDSTGTSLKREVAGLIDREYTYTNANLVSDYGAEPTSFIVRLTNVKSGIESGIVEETIVRV
ncbi:MAG: hypothetical protein GY906_13040 [bacterium]|nr:hypothetical protein [bacterium]